MQALPLDALPAAGKRRVDGSVDIWAHGKNNSADLGNYDTANHFIYLSSFRSKVPHNMALSFWSLFRQT